jgi:gentisate 1,2-dioxygenase
MSTEYYSRLAAQNTAPLWEVLGAIVPAQPRPTSAPAIWRYDDLRPLLLEAGGRITAEEAERRVLILENPTARGQSRTTSSLYAGLQLVMPGEVAATHRHVAAALRLVLESEGGYTTVNGERISMHPGDFILTPSWSWHSHGNPGEKPVIWLDGLDIPIVNLFETSFLEHHTGQAAVRCDSTLNYPYVRSREQLERLSRAYPLHQCNGVKMQLLELPTLAAFLQFLPAGFDGAPYRSTDGAVFCAVEGQGTSRVGDVTFAWKKHDVFVIPSWCPVSHRADSESVLFSFSDRPVQKSLGLWREQAPMI